MENSNSLQKKSRILCPECSNYIDGKLLESGAISGQCKVPLDYHHILGVNNVHLKRSE